MKRASYRSALEWIAMNDDTEWLDDEPLPGEDGPPPSVTACLVADLFGKDTSTVAGDLRRTLERLEREDKAAGRERVWR